MPTYDYQCSNTECKHIFEEVHKIPDRKLPESKPCPKCGQLTIEQAMLGAPALGDPVRMGIRKPGGDFKEVLHKIHENMPGSTLDRTARHF